LSVNREDFGVEYEVTAGTTKTLTATLIDPDTGTAQVMTDTNVFNTGIVKIYKPDGTTVGSSMNINFYDRANGLIKFTVDGTVLREDSTTVTGLEQRTFADTTVTVPAWGGMYAIEQVLYGVFSRDKNNDGSAKNKRADNTRIH